MTSSGLIGTGAVGTALTALCCFTPVLVLSLGALGLSAWLAAADFVLFPLLVLCLAVAGVGLWHLKRQRTAAAAAACCAAGAPTDERITP